MQIFEHWANARCFLPMEDYPVFWWRMRHFAREHEPTRQKLGVIPDRIVAEIRETGPRTSHRIESDEKVLGYWDLDLPRTKATSLALELLWESGELMIAGRSASLISETSGLGGEKSRPVREGRWLISALPRVNWFRSRSKVLDASITP